MSLLITMLPIYLLGNLHCIGMCGPLVLMLGKHEYRYCYFLGRLISFTLAGLMAGGLGSLLNLVLSEYHIPVVASFAFGAFLLLLGVYQIGGWQYPGYRWLSRKLARTNQRLSLLMMRDNAWTTFLFGFFTILLPCGQTLIVFSACALSGSALVGLVNGFAFALLTSPSLWLAMNMHKVMHRFKSHYQTVMGVCAVAVGILAICRGLAEMDVVEHLVLSEKYHVVVF